MSLSEPPPLQASAAEIVDSVPSAGETAYTELVDASYYIGPLPPASELQDYDAIVPGMADRIVGNWEAESDHRRTLERQQSDADTRLLERELRLLERGQGIAAILAVLFFGGSVYLVASGHGLAGMAVVIAEIAALAAVFYLGRKKEPQEGSSLEESRSEDAVDKTA